MTTGTMALHRGSETPVVQVVQPRFDAPPTTKSRTRTPAFFCTKSVTVSIARATAFVIGRRSSHSGE